MELICLFCLYYLSQNPQFSESVKPLMSTLKNSEQMLKFINDLSKFSAYFSSGAQPNDAPPNPPPKPNEKKEQAPNEKKENHSPTEKIADEFIEQVLGNYFKNR
ncbi:MAG: hypothetical protein E7343_00220 [Clostridiales bacterium]|nr:hypothetical protein [Clostridiales bacterium]